MHDELSTQQNGECGALSELAIQLDRTVMRFRDPFYDRKPKPEAAVLPGAGLVSAVKALEHMGDGFRWYAGSRVGYLDAETAVIGLELHQDLAARAGVADRIVEQVQHEAAQQFLIAPKSHIRRTRAFYMDGFCASHVF